jgi:hypothetical protein
LTVRDAINVLSKLDEDLELVVYVYDPEYSSTLEKVTYIALGGYSRSPWGGHHPSNGGRKVVVVHT